MSVCIVYEKNEEADDNGKITDLADACHDPHDDQNDVVDSVCKCIMRIAAEAEIDGKEACADGEDADGQICCMEVCEHNT